MWLRRPNHRPPWNTRRWSRLLLPRSRPRVRPPRSRPQPRTLRKRNAPIRHRHNRTSPPQPPHRRSRLPRLVPSSSRPPPGASCHRRCGFASRTPGPVRRRRRRRGARCSCAHRCRRPLRRRPLRGISVVQQARVRVPPRLRPGRRSAHRPAYNGRKRLWAGHVRCHRSRFARRSHRVRVERQAIVRPLRARRGQVAPRDAKVRVRRRCPRRLPHLPRSRARSRSLRA